MALQIGTTGSDRKRSNRLCLQLAALGVSLTTGLLTLASCSRFSKDQILTETPIEKSLLDFRPKSARLNEKINLRPKAGHHFNLEAPQRCGENPWIDRTPTSLSCQLEAARAHPISVSICDDAKTFCVLEKFIINTVN